MKIGKSLIGRKFKNLKDLCSFFGFEYSEGGMERQKLIRDIEKCFTLSKQGNSLTIVEVKKNELIRLDERKVEVKEKPHENLEGKNFGSLKVVSFKRRKDNSSGRMLIDWICECNCGNEVISLGKTLKNGSITCCSQCFINKKDSKIALELKKYYKKFNSGIVEYKILVNPDTGRFLPFDIYLPNENIYIEIQGEQHYKFISTFHVNVDNFEYSQYKDKLKKEFAEENGIFIEIDLRKIKNSIDAIIFINEIMKDIK